MRVFMTIGLTSKSAQAANGTSTLLVVAFAFVSAAYVPAHSLPSWMQPVADNQPFTVFSNALRSLTTVGGAHAVGLGYRDDLLGAVEPDLGGRDLRRVQHDRRRPVRSPPPSGRRDQGQGADAMVKVHVDV